MSRRDDVLKALGVIEKNHGAGSAMFYGDAHLDPVEAISTSSISLDIALGVGGIPRGRITEIYGPESSGKTTLATHVMAEAQKNGGLCAFIDVEHAFDPIYAEAIGCSVRDLVISQPDTAEQALAIVGELVNSGGIDVIVVDSVAALVPRAEVEGDFGDSHMGLQARLMSQAMRKLNGTISKTDTAAIFLNQLRSKIGVMFGSPEVTSGGNALKFYASVRLDIRRKEQIKDKETNITGNKTLVKVVKNKVAPPFKTAEFDIMYGQGISKEGDVLTLALATGLVKASGAWITDVETGEQVGNGREKAKLFLAENPDYYNSLRERILELV